MRRSITGPLLLLILGAAFLWKNLHPEVPVFEVMSQYWPFLLIGWGLVRLVEVIFWRDSDRQPGGFSGGEVMLVILICCAGSLVWAARDHGIRIDGRGLNLWGSSFDYQVDAKAPAGIAKRIVFENPRGNIKVVGADTNEITITGHKSVRAYSRADADKTNTNTPVEIVPQGDRLLIRTNQDRSPDNQQMSDDLEVTVPRLLSVESSGRNGDYEVTDLIGDIELTIDRGDVRMSRIEGNARLNIGRSDLIRAIDLKGRLDVQGDGSDVELENVGGQVTISGAYKGTLDFKNLAKPLSFDGRNTEFSVQALPGRVSMSLGDFNGTDLVGPVRLIGSRSRDIRMEKFTQSLELENERGDIELHPGRVPLASIEARTGSGRVELVLPEKGNFVLDASAERGEGVNDFGPQIQRESEGRSTTLRGKVGEGGPTLHITSKRGSISVRKEGVASGETTGAPAGKAKGE